MCSWKRGELEKREARDCYEIVGEGRAGNGMGCVALQTVGHRDCICIIPIITLVFLQYHSNLVYIRMHSL